MGNLGGNPIRGLGLEVRNSSVEIRDSCSASGLEILGLGFEIRHSSFETRVAQSGVQVLEVRDSNSELEIRDSNRTAM